MRSRGVFVIMLALAGLAGCKSEEAAEQSLLRIGTVKRSEVGRQTPASWLAQSDQQTRSAHYYAPVWTKVRGYMDSELEGQAIDRNAKRQE